MTTSIYDAAERHIAHVNALGTRVTTVLDPVGNAIAEINGLGFITSTSYEPRNLVSGRQEHGWLVALPAC
jgi:hypothetical protein